MKKKKREQGVGKHLKTIEQSGKCYMSGKGFGVFRYQAAEDNGRSGKGQGVVLL